jgi:hypothetical protein
MPPKTSDIVRCLATILEKAAGSWEQFEELVKDDECTI